QIISTKDDFFDALHLLAVIEASLGKQDQALAIYNRALSVRPADAAVLNNCGITLHKLKRHEDALASFDRALSVRPGSAEAAYNRGNVLKELKRLGEAAASYKQALVIRPDHAEAYNNIGIILRELGRVKEAQDNFERAIRLSPKTPIFYLNLATVRPSVVGDPYLSAMQELARDMKSLNAADQISLEFALGKALADIGQDRQSFQHLLRGNSLKRRQFAYDEGAELKRFQDIQKVFTPELLHRKSGLGDPSDI